LKPYERFWEDNFTDMAVDMRGWFGGDGLEPHRIHIRGQIARMGYSTVLDAGAGLCAEYFGFRAEHPSIDYSALDITPAFVEEGLQRGINIHQGSVENMPFESDSFDCVYIRDTMRHLDNFELAIREGIRVAKHELTIVFASSLARGPENELRFDQKNGVHNNRWSVVKLTQMLEREPSISWYYFQSIAGKKNPADLLRIFKNISTSQKIYLSVHFRWKNSLFWIRPKIGMLIRLLVGKGLARRLKSLLGMK